MACISAEQRLLPIASFGGVGTDGILPVEDRLVSQVSSWPPWPGALSGSELLL
jgi:hypothetical protein